MLTEHVVGTCAVVRGLTVKLGDHDVWLLHNDLQTINRLGMQGNVAKYCVLKTFRQTLCTDLSCARCMTIDLACIKLEACVPLETLRKKLRN